jgi:hypothetical protein
MIQFKMLGDIELLPLFPLFLLVFKKFGCGPVSNTVNVSRGRKIMLTRCSLCTLW